MGTRKSGLRVMDMFIIHFMVMISQVDRYVKTYQIGHFKYMQFLVCHYTAIKLLKYINKVERGKISPAITVIIEGK